MAALESSVMVSPAEAAQLIFSGQAKMTTVDRQIIDTRIPSAPIAPTMAPELVLEQAPVAPARQRDRRNVA